MKSMALKSKKNRRDLLRAWREKIFWSGKMLVGELSSQRKLSKETAQ